MSAAPRRVLLLGGTSEIGLAIVRRLAADGPVRAALLGRDHDRLQAAADELRRRGITETTVQVAADAQDLGRAAQAAVAALGGVDVAVLAVGQLGAQAGLDADPAEAAEVMQVGFVYSGLLMLHCLRALRAQAGGTLVVLSSVAGERVRASNAVYGAAKAGLDGLASGLADATAGNGVRVLVVRPGFVVGRMTAGLPRPPLASTPDEVAEATVRGLAGRAGIVWVPGALRWVMMLLRLTPRPLWRRLPL